MSRIIYVNETDADKLIDKFVATFGVTRIAADDSG